MTTTIKVLETSTTPPPPARGRKSALLEQLDALLAGIDDTTWALIYDGTVTEASKIVAAAGAKAVRARYTVRRRGGQVWVVRQPSPSKAGHVASNGAEPATTVPAAATAGTPVSSWRPEGVPPATWVALRPNDRDRCAAAIHRITDPHAKAAAIAELDVSLTDIASTIKTLRTKGLL